MYRIVGSQNKCMVQLSHTGNTWIDLLESEVSYRTALRFCITDMIKRVRISLKLYEYSKEV